jgi:hypothetical protein
MLLVCQEIVSHSGWIAYSLPLRRGFLILQVVWVLTTRWCLIYWLSDCNMESYFNDNLLWRLLLFHHGTDLQTWSQCIDHFARRFGLGRILSPWLVSRLSGYPVSQPLTPKSRRCRSRVIPCFDPSSIAPWHVIETLAIVLYLYASTKRVPVLPPRFLPMEYHLLFRASRF